MPFHTARHLLTRTCAILVSGLALAGSPLQAATSLPDGQLQLIAPFSAGGPVDAIGRLLAERLSHEAGRSLIVLNQPGASGNIGAAAAAKASPDGRTVFLTTDTVLTVNPLIYRNNLPFDPDSDLRAVGTTGGISLVLVVHPEVPAQTLQEFVALARSQPLHYGSGGSGAPGHLTFEAFLDAADVKIDHISYKGNAPAVRAVLGGEVKAGFVGISNALPHIQAGKLRALAVSTAERSPFLPDTPTIAESGYPGFDVRFNLYTMVPAATPDAVVEAWESTLAAILQNPEVQQRIMQVGLDPVYASADATTQRMRAARDRWQPIVERLGITVE